MAKEHDDGIFAFLLGMIFGVIGGGIAALLYAPKPGEETREDVKALAKTLPGKMNDDFNDPNGKTRVFLDKTFYNLETQVDKMNRAVKARKMAEAKRREEMATGYEHN